jgi:GDP-4-dehydro-6-deoxy-D-mannose reductase
MRVLVTGASGFVGAHLAPLLRQRRHEVTTLSREGDVDFTVDVTDADALARCVRAIRPAGIVHLAAIAFVPDAEGNADRAHAVNVGGTRNVIDAAAEVGARVVFASSGAVYGDGGSPDARVPFVETAPLAPRGVYAETKAAAEEECRRARGRVDVVRVRAFNHTGPGQEESYVCSSFAKQIAAAMLGVGSTTLEVGDLTAERDFCDVRDIVRAYALALERGAAGEVYNACSGSPTRIRWLLDLMIELAGVRMDVRTEPSRLRVREASRLWGDNSKIATALGWRPEITLRDSLSDLLTWWRERLAARR